MNTEIPLLRRVVAIVAVANLAYFGVEFAAALAIGSVSLFADSIDFLEDAAVNFLVLVALGWSARRRSQIGTVLALMLLAPGIATLWTAGEKIFVAVPPDAMVLSVAATGSLVVNLLCARALAPFRSQGGSLVRAAFLSARNDVLAGVGILAAGALTVTTRSHWPDLVVGLGILVVNLDAAREVLEAAAVERTTARAAGD